MVKSVLLLLVLMVLSVAGLGQTAAGGGAPKAGVAAHSAAKSSVQGAGALPSFTGTWKLDMGRSKLQAAHTPVSSTAWIQYDGKEWRYRRMHTYKDGKSETWSIELAVDSKLTHMEKDGPLTFFSKIHKDGAGLVLVEDITAVNGEKATNTVRYSLIDGGKTLVETEHEVTPKGNELNRWVFGKVG